MPINVVCPGCHSRWSVSDKFAGKQGPCPKCKTVMTIPKASEEVKIHAPDDYGGAKSTTGKLVLKPIAREVVKLNTNWVLAIGAAALITAGLAYILGRAFREEVAPTVTPVTTQEKPDPTAPPALTRQPEATQEGPTYRSTVPTILLAAGALGLAIPLVLAAYSFLRDDEMEGYRGKELLIRAAICGVVYALLWGGFWLMGEFGVEHTPVFWVFAGPVVFAIGGAAAYFALDLDFTSAVMHYAFYLVITVLLRVIMGLPAL